MPFTPTKKLQPGQKIRVLVVDDSVVIRRLVTQALMEQPLIEVVGSASNGQLALQRIPQLNPDVITLDVEMPEMDGLETLKNIQKKFSSLRVIMFSTLTERGAATTLEALSLGANDYVTKASNSGSLDVSMARLREELVPKIKQFFVLPTPERPASQPVRLAPTVTPMPTALSRLFRADVVAIGVSTGGPNALGAIFPCFPANFPRPILIVQHMPPLFTHLLAERLSAVGKIKVEEAKEGSVVEPGKALIAPGDWHLRVKRRGTRVVTTIDQGPQENSCRPSVDVLFRSVGEVWGAKTLAVILTGMGQDGLRGMQQLKAQGAFVLAQDEASSVVWGMPGAVVTAGLADAIVPLDQVPAEIMKRV